MSASMTYMLCAYVSRSALSLHIPAMPNIPAHICPIVQIPRIDAKTLPA